MKKIIAGILFCCFSTGVAIVIAGQTDKINLENEKLEIRKLISNETETYYKQDFESWKKNFVNADHYRQHGYWEGYPDKVRYFNGCDTLFKVKELQFRENRTYWKGSYEIRYNENFRIYKDAAWYTFEQDSFEKGSNRFLGRSVETRILEKIKSEWKIAYIGYHYLPISTTGTTNSSNETGLFD